MNNPVWPGVCPGSECRWNSSPSIAPTLSLLSTTTIWPAAITGANGTVTVYKNGVATTLTATITVGTRIGPRTV